MINTKIKDKLETMSEIMSEKAMIKQNSQNNKNCFNVPYNSNVKQKVFNTQATDFQSPLSDNLKFY